MRHTSILLALAALASAQTTSECDPTKGDKCAPDPAFGNCGKETYYDFAKVPHGGDAWKKDKSFLDFWKPEKGIVYDNSPLSIGDDGAVMTITNKDQAPLVKTNRYLFFGKVEVEVRAAPGVGIVTSVVLESDDRDEIDWEWIGGEQTNVQTNFFSKGANEYVNGLTHGIAFNAMEGLHTYTIDWTPDSITFSVDGAEIRRATPGDYAKWPQTPAQVKLGTWVGGKKDNPQGTIDWAGGLADFEQAPFIGAYKSVRITDYCGGKASAKEYVYTDASGSKDSIEVVGGSGEGGFGDGKKPEETTKEPKETSTTVATRPSSGSSATDKDKTAEPTAEPTGEASKTAGDDKDGPESTGKPDPSKGSGDDDGDDEADDEGSNDKGSNDEGDGDEDDDSAASLTGVSSTLAALVGLGYLVMA